MICRSLRLRRPMGPACCVRLFSARPLLVTTPIFYVNAAPHIGHAYSVVLADALCRWHRCCGERVIFTTGTDEHGSKVAEAAERSGVGSTLAYCDEVSAKFRHMCVALHVAPDDFVRTSEARHRRTVQHLWRRLRDGGHIYLGTHEGWYCRSDETFLTEKQVTSDRNGGKISAESGHPVEWVSEPNYMFRLPSLVPEVKAWLGGRDGSAPPVVPVERFNEVSNMLGERHEGKVGDLSVSRPRSRVPWAIPVPDDEAHSVYVWLDALANYITVSGVDLEDPASLAPHSWPSATHVVGKDILKFHAVYWPAFLLGAGLPLPSRVVAHGHWTVDRTKMSKSLGNVVCPIEATKSYGADEVRYVLLRDGRISDDADFNPEALRRAHADLADTLGNLASRVVGTKIMPELVWPSPSRAATAALQAASLGVEVVDDFVSLGHFGSELARCLAALPRRVDVEYRALRFDRGIDAIFGALHLANRHFQAEEPWRLGNCTAAGSEEDDKARLAAVVFLTLETLRVSALLLSPVVPAASAQLLKALSADAKATELPVPLDGAPAPGTPLLLPGPGRRMVLFPRRLKQGGEGNDS